MIDLYKIDIPRLRLEPLVECVNCPICLKCMCGDSSYGVGVCAPCAMNMERPPPGMYPWLGLDTWVSERLDEFWEHADKELVELDFEALEAAIEGMGT